MTKLFPPAVYGGAQGLYYNIAKYYPNNNIVILADCHDEAEAFDKAQKYHIYRKPIWDIRNKANPILIFQLFKCIQYLFNIIRKEKIEHLVVGQCHNIVFASASILVGKFFRIPVTLFGHGEDVSKVLNTDLRSNHILKFLYKFPDYFIANSEFTKDMWMKLGCASEKIHILNPCVDSDFLHPLQNYEQLKAQHNLSQNKVLLTIGRLVPRKGYDTVIKSLPVLEKKFPNITYIIIGSGKGKQYLIDLSKKHKVEDKVFFWNKVTKEKLREALNICDLFVMPNREVEGAEVEGFGMVFLEANSCGKPVIGGRSGGTNDAVEDGKSGFLCDPNSIEDFIEKATLLLSDTELSKHFGDYGRKRAKLQFNWQKNVSMFFSKFTSL